MKIIFVLPDIGFSGGVNIVFRYADLLTSRGHDVFIVYPFLRKSIGEILINPRTTISRSLSDYRNFMRWRNTNVNIIKAFGIADSYIPDADIVVATWWETAYYVNQLSESKGKKFYFIQHYEVWGGPKEQVDKSYKLGLFNIVISSWLKNKLEEIGADIETLILNSVDYDEFYPEKINRNDNEIRILMPYRSQEWKGIADGMAAIKIVRQKFQNIRLVMFGPRARGMEDFGKTEFHVFPTGAKLRRVYNSCDIFLFPSHCEGFGLPPMEAMACRIPVVTTNVGAIPDYTIAGETAMVSEPKDIDALAHNLILLIEDCGLRKRIAENGYQYASKYTWDNSINKLERVFDNKLKKHKASV